MLKPDLTGFTCFYFFRVFRCFYTGRHPLLSYSVRLANRIWRVLRTGRGPTHCIPGREYAQRSASFQEGLTASFRLRFSSAHQRKKRVGSADRRKPIGNQEKKKAEKKPGQSRAIMERKEICFQRKEKTEKKSPEKSAPYFFTPLSLFPHALLP